MPKRKFNMEPIGIPSVKSNFSYAARPCPVKVLLIGNNPMDISHCNKTLITYRKRKFLTDFTFDVHEAQKKALSFKPGVIAIDDNIGYPEAESIVNIFKSDPKTSQIPIVLIKSSNYQPVLNSGIREYLLRENVSEKLPELAIRIFHQRETYQPKDKPEGLFSFLWGK